MRPRLVVCLVLVLCPFWSFADCEETLLFNIAPQTLNKALLLFAQQAQVSVFFPEDLYSTMDTGGLSGFHCPDEALAKLLEGLEVTGILDATGRLILQTRTASAASIAAPHDQTGNDERGLIQRIMGRFLSSIETPSADHEALEEQTAPLIEEITVTGSRITRTGLDTPTPVTALRRRDIDVLSPDQLVDAMSLLPQFMANSGPATIGTLTGPTGASFVNLRGIGYNRTLVLLDGRRIAPSSRLGTPDIAMLPQSLIKNVEIITGGASAAYGSDAVSGVVNYALDTGFTGFSSQLQLGISARDDNARHKWSLTLGQNLGERTHLLVALEGFEADRVESYEKRHWFRDWGTVDINGPGQPQVVAADLRSRLYTAGGLIRLPGSALDMLHFTHGGKVETFEDGTLIGATRQVGGTGFLGDIANKEADQTGHGSLYPDNTRGSAFLHLDHQLDSNSKVYAQLWFGYNNLNFLGHGAHQETEAWHATLYADNAFIPAEILDIMQAEGRESFPLYRYASSHDLARARGLQDNQTGSTTLGFSSTLADWRLNGYYQYGRSRSKFTAQDFPRLDRLYRAMDAVLDPDSGTILCRSTLTFPGDGCVAANPFGAGTMSSTAVDYILDGDMYRDSVLIQHMAEFSMDSDFSLRALPDVLSLAVGLTYREESFAQGTGPKSLVDRWVFPEQFSGYKGLPSAFIGPNVLQFSGISDMPLSGRFNVWELFTEGVLPLLRDYRGINELDLHLAWRHANYSGSGGVNAWKAGLDWRVNDVLRLRATRSRDTRAATLVERFERSGGGVSAFDPLLQKESAFSQALGGNPNVDPELADTWTAGFIFQPRSLSGAALSVDWYDVRIHDYIAMLGASRIIDDCHAGNMTLCELVIRDPESQRLLRVDNLYLNTAAARVRGVDVELSNQLPVPWLGGPQAQLMLRLYASFLLENSYTDADGVVRNSAGSVELPKSTLTALLRYSQPAFSLDLTGRYIGSRVQYTEPVALADRLDDNSVDSVFYLNSRLGINLDAPGSSRLELYLNIANLLDRDPPVVANWSDFWGASAFVSSLHDALGRRYTLGLRYDY